MSKHWRWFIPGHLWLLPFTLGYAIFCFLVYGARSWGFRNGVLIAVAGKSMIGNPGAQTIGAMTCFANTTELARKDLAVHENTHIVEAFLFGLSGFVFVPLALLLAGLPFAWGFLLSGTLGAAAYSLVYGVTFGWYYFTTQKDEGPGWHDDYRRNFLEEAAYAAQARYVAASPEEKAGYWV